MMGDSSLIALKLVGLFLLLTTVASWIAAAGYPVFRRQLERLASGRRSVLRILYAAMPVIASTLVLLLMMKPGLGGFIVPEHCHGNSCGTHSPLLGGGTLASAVFAAFGALGGMMLLAALVWITRRALGRLRMVDRLTRFADRRGGYRVLDNPGFVACCVGLLRPQVLVSQGVIDALPEDELQAVMAHEQAHAHRRDNLRGLVVYGVTLAWPGSQRQRLRQDLAADAEQACDAYAATVTRDPQVVKRAIERLSVPGHQWTTQRGAAFGECDVGARVARLEDHANAPVSGVLASAGLGLFWLVLVSALTVLSHGFLEWLASVGW
jgi:Zn-dependent protease with chaperone function